MDSKNLNTRIKTKAVRYLSRFPATKSKLKKFLETKFKDDQIDNLYKEIDAVVEWLEKKRFINDNQFGHDKAMALIRKGNPEMTIRVKLKEKGISNEGLEHIIENLKNEHGDLNKLAAMNYTQSLLNQKKVKFMEEYDKKEYILKKLSMKGFSYFLAQEMINDEVLKEI